MTAAGPGRLLVVSAHAADFVWRAGGYIAVVTAAGGTAHVLCLSFGERGESPGAWKQPGMTLERVKEIRRAEAQEAGDALGAARAGPGARVAAPAARRAAGVPVRKLAAMAAMRSQEHLASYYRDLAERRGVQAVRNGGSRAIRYAEAYQRVFPQVSGVLT